MSDMCSVPASSFKSVGSRIMVPYYGTAGNSDLYNKYYQVNAFILDA